MSEVLLLLVGVSLFVLTTAATLWSGYLTFQRRFDDVVEEAGTGEPNPEVLELGNRRNRKRRIA